MRRVTDGHTLALKNETVVERWTEGRGGESYRANSSVSGSIAPAFCPQLCCHCLCCLIDAF